MKVVLRYQSSGMVPSDNQPLEMRGPSLTLGRGATNDVVLPDPDQMLSRNHCVIEDHGTHVAVVDLSSNGTFLNYGKMPLGPTPTPVNNGDVIILGGYELAVEIIEENAPLDPSMLDPMAADPLSPGNADNAPDPYALLDDVGPEGDFLDDLLGAETPRGPSQLNPVDPIDDLLPPLGEEEDPFFRKPGAEAGLEGQGASLPAHNPAWQDNMAAPRAPSADVIPDDWDDDFFAGIGGGEAAQPASPPPMAAPPHPMPPAGAQVAIEAAQPTDPLSDPLLGTAGPEAAVDPIDALLGGGGDPFAEAAPAAPDAGPVSTPVSAPQAPVQHEVAGLPASDPLDDLLAEHPPAQPEAQALRHRGLDPFAEAGDGPATVPIADTGPLDDPIPMPGAPVSEPGADDLLGDDDPFAEMIEGVEDVTPQPVPPEPAATPVAMARMAQSQPAPATANGAVEPAQAGSPVATGSVAASGAGLEAFLRGLDVEELQLSEADSAPVLERMGRVMRTVITGLREILMTRTSIKSEFRIEQTMIAAGGNNPLKFSISPEQAIEAMVKPRARGYLDAEAAAAEALRDIKAHEVAMVTGMEAALKGVLARLDPKALEGQIEKRGGLGGLLRNKKAQYWDVYGDLYADIADQAENEFHELFSREFARAYKAQLDRLKSNDTGA